MSKRVYEEGTEVYYGGAGPYIVDFYRKSPTGPMYDLINNTYGNRVLSAPAHMVHHLSLEERLRSIEEKLGLDDE